MYDPELPAGLQDADFEMRELEATAKRAAALRAKGICTHGHSQGFTRSNGSKGTKCLNCPAIFADDEDWFRSHRALVG